MTESGVARHRPSFLVPFESPSFASALAVSAIGTGICAYAIHQIIGWAGLIGIIGALLVLGALSLIARREAIEWHGLLPISLLAFVGWACASIFWSHYHWVTLAGLLYLIGFTGLGLYVALVRDTIQIVRSYGDVLRFVIAVSLALEVFAGLLIDHPIAFIAIQGNLDILGPITGLAGTRNQLGLLAVVGAITFGVELRTRSISRNIAVASLLGAGVTILFSRSPVALGVSVIVAIAVAALYGVRRVRPDRRTFWQFGVLAAAALLAALAWVYRGPIVSALNGGGDLSYRLHLWQQIWLLIPLNPLQGLGWTGAWHPEVQPFSAFTEVVGRSNVSAVNAYLDVWFQLGVIGMLLFVGMAGLAFVRSWLLAGNKRSIVYAWPAVVLLALLLTNLAESSLLIEFGWMTFVICCVKASQQLSWRQAFAAIKSVEKNE